MGGRIARSPIFWPSSRRTDPPCQKPSSTPPTMHFCSSANPLGRRKLSAIGGDDTIREEANGPQVHRLP